MIPGGDVIAARPQLVTRLSVECVQDCVGGARNTSGGTARSRRAAERHWWRAKHHVLAAGVSKHDSVGDDRWVGMFHIARNPRRVQLESPSGCISLHPERRDGAIEDLPMFDRRRKFPMLRAPEGHQN